MNEIICPTCKRKFTINSVNAQCPYCGTTLDKGYIDGYFQGQQSQNGNTNSSMQGLFDEGPSGKSRGVAGLLAITLGCFGVHYFYVGKNTAGVVFLAITLLSCFIFSILTYIAAIAQGIIMLTSTQEEFEQKYIYTSSTLPLF